MEPVTGIDRLLPVLFVLIWIIALVHIVAEYNYWYWVYRWFDIPVHFMGGVWLGLAGLWVWYTTSGFRKKSWYKKISAVKVSLLTGLLVGVVWELYEFGVWQLIEGDLPVNYYADTLLDIVMDVFGAFFGYLVYRFVVRGSAPNT